MVFSEGRVPLFVHGRPVDMRKSFTGLIALTKHTLRQDPLSGHLFVFVNHRGDYLEDKRTLRGVVDQPRRHRLRVRLGNKPRPAGSQARV
jgi:transposase